METKRQIWEQIVAKLTFKQYKIVTDRSLSYIAMFNNILNYTKSKKLHALAKKGLEAPFTLVKEKV